MMKIEAPMRRAVEPRAIDDVSLLIHKKGPEPMPICGIIFQISILDDDNVARHLPQSRTKSGAFAAVALVEKRADCGDTRLNCFLATSATIRDGHCVPGSSSSNTRVIADNLLQPFSGAIGRAVIDNNNLLINLRERRNYLI